jgi:spermidine/putrescine transport system substrate-binding protein
MALVPDLKALKLTSLACLAILVATLIGCTSNKAASTDNGVKTESATKGGREVHLAIWANYLSPEAQVRFTKETGIKLLISNFSSNEELLAKVQAGASGIDVAVPSDYMVGVMTKLELLHEIDLGKVPNFKGLDTHFTHLPFDPGNKYSVPYSWTLAGIAINLDLFKGQIGQIKGWKDLWSNKELAGKFSMLDDAREVFATALKVNGLPVNSTDEAQLKRAQATLKVMRPNVKMFRSDTIDPLVNKEVIAAHAYSSDALQASKKAGGKIEFILPEEGGTRGLDNLSIVKSAKNVEEAHILINFLLSPDVNLEFVKTIMGGPVVAGTREKLPPELQNQAALFPTEAVLAKFESFSDVGPATRLYERLWTEIKSQ